MSEALTRRLCIQHMSWNHVSPRFCQRCWGTIVPTVDGRNFAPVDMVNLPLFRGFHTCWVVQDSFHQQYEILLIINPCPFLDMSKFDPTRKLWLPRPKRLSQSWLVGLWWLWRAWHYSWWARHVPKVEVTFVEKDPLMYYTQWYPYFI